MSQMAAMSPSHPHVAAAHRLNAIDEMVLAHPTLSRDLSVLVVSELVVRHSVALVCVSVCVCVCVCGGLQMLSPSSLSLSLPPLSLSLSL
jgi:hypothetical protein